MHHYAKNNASYNAFEETDPNYVINLSYLNCKNHYFSVVVVYRIKPRFDQFEI